MIKGDRVIIYMLMIFEVVMVMFVCVRFGVIYFVVFGGFVFNELVVWIEDVELKVIMMVLCGIEVDKILFYKLLVDCVILDSDWKLEKVLVL